MNNSKRKKMYRLSLLNSVVDTKQETQKVEQKVLVENAEVKVEATQPQIQNGLKELQEDDKSLDKKKLKFKKPVEEEKQSDV